MNRNGRIAKKIEDNSKLMAEISDRLFSDMV